MPRKSSRPNNERTKTNSTKRKGSAAVKKMDEVLKKRKPVDVDDVEDKPRRRSKKKKKDVSAQIDAVKREAMENLEEALEEDEGEEAITSAFQEDFLKLKALVDPSNEDLSMDNTAPLFFRASLSMLLDLMPLAEDAYRKSTKESAAYALVALMNQIRDINNDLRMSEDVAGKTFTINDILSKALTQIAEHMLRQRYTFDQKIDSMITKPEVRKALKTEVSNYVRTVAEGIDSIQKLSDQRVEAYFNGDPHYMNPGLVDHAPAKKSKKSKKK